MHKKSPSEGIGERLGLLEQHEPGIRGLLKRVLSETSRKQVAADDVLDAAVAFVTSEAQIMPNAYRHVPSAVVDGLDPSVDSSVSFGGAYAR